MVNVSEEQRRHNDSRLEREMKQVYDETLRLSYADFVQRAADVRDRGRSLGKLTHAQSLEVIRAGEHLWQKLGEPRAKMPRRGLLLLGAIMVVALALLAVAALAGFNPGPLGR